MSAMAPSRDARPKTPRRPGVTWLLVIMMVGCHAEAQPPRIVARAAQTAREQLGEGTEAARHRWRRVEQNLAGREIDWRALGRAVDEAVEELERTRGSDDVTASAEARAELPWWDRWPEAVRCDDEHCEVRQWLVLRGRQEPQRMAHGVRIEPVLRGQSVVAYRLAEVPESSPAHRIGFRKGDEVRWVNGRSVTEPLAQMSLFAQLGERRRFVVTVVRDGEQHAIVLDVVE